MKKLFLIIISLCTFNAMLTAPNSPVVIPLILNEPLTKGFANYADDLGWYESGNNPDTINSIGCFAEHQWRESTLKELGYRDITLKRFRQNPLIFPRDMQREALKALTDTNKVKLEPYKFYIGHIISGVKITESGMIAACHLGGFNSVKEFLESNGKINHHDRYGTSIKDYIVKFRNYRL